MKVTVIIPTNKVECSCGLTDKLETLFFSIGGSPYPRMDGRKIASLLQEGKRMPKPQHVDDKLQVLLLKGGGGLQCSCFRDFDASSYGQL